MNFSQLCVYFVLIVHSLLPKVHESGQLELRFFKHNISDFYTIESVPLQADMVRLCGTIVSLVPVFKLCQAHYSEDEGRVEPTISWEQRSFPDEYEADGTAKYEVGKNMYNWMDPEDIPHEITENGGKLVFPYEPDVNSWAKKEVDSDNYWSSDGAAYVYARFGNRNDSRSDTAPDRGDREYIKIWFERPVSLSPCDVLSFYDSTNATNYKLLDRYTGIQPDNETATIIWPMRHGRWYKAQEVAMHMQTCKTPEGKWVQEDGFDADYWAKDEDYNQFEISWEYVDSPNIELNECGLRKNIQDTSIDYLGEYNPYNKKCTFVVGPGPESENSVTLGRLLDQDGNFNVESSSDVKYIISNVEDGSLIEEITPRDDWTDGSRIVYPFRPFKLELVAGAEDGIYHSSDGPANGEWQFFDSSVHFLEQGMNKFELETGLKWRDQQNNCFQSYIGNSSIGSITSWSSHDPHNRGVWPYNATANIHGDCEWIIGSEEVFSDKTLEIWFSDYKFEQYNKIQNWDSCRHSQSNSTGYFYSNGTQIDSSLCPEVSYEPAVSQGREEMSQIIITDAREEGTRNNQTRIHSVEN